MSDHPKLSTVKVSIGYGVSFAKPNKIHLADIYNNFIRNPKANHVPAIKELREFIDQHIDRFNTLEAIPKDERTPEETKERGSIKNGMEERKNTLQAFTWSGIFSPRSTEGFIEHSGRLQGDIDLKSKPRGYSEQLRDRLGKDPHVEVAFLSPTGRGVKIGILIPICTNEAEHRQAYLAAERYFRENYDVILDPSRKDIAGICFFSHDPDLITNPNAVPLDIEKWSPDKKKSRSLFNAATYGKTSTEPQTAETKGNDEALLDAGENLIYDNSSPGSPTELPESSPSPKKQKRKKSTQEYDDLSTDDLVDILKSIQGADDRETWVKVGHALKEYLGDQGYPFWATWSSQSNKWNDVDESKNREKWDGFDPTNINGQATLIYLAKQGGWTWKNTKGQKRKRDRQKTSADADHPARRGGGTSTGAETEATETDSAEETTPNTTTEPDAGQTTKGNFHIEKNKSGEDVYVPNHHNINEFFETRKFSIWYDNFTRQILTTMGQEDGTVVEWSDDLTINLTMNFQSFKGMRRLSRNIVDDIIHMYSRKNPRNQLTDWLDSLQWDKTPRLDHWLSRYCGAEDNIYVREVARCWLLGAVTRGYRPGTQFDHVLIFEGPQGSGKSSAIRILSNGWFTELESFTGKESAEVLAGGVWLVELSELDGMKKSDVESVKRFITTLADRYRPAYGRHVISVPRSCVFAGSTNETSYLRDSTGNRRFWPVKCADIDLEQLRADRDVLIAEAVYRYKQGESLLMNEEAREIAVEAQEDRFQVDSWEDAISKYIENKKDVSMADVLENGLLIDNKSMWTKGTEMRVGNILKRLGWSKRRVREGGGRERVYRYHKDS